MKVIVTGAASGIGKALCRELLAQGHYVFGVDIDEVNLRTLLALAEPERVAVERLDVREPRAWNELVRRVLQRFGRIDVLCNVAGYLRPGYAHESTAEDVARHIDINVKGVALGTQAVLPQMREQRAGHIINVGSLAGLSPVPGLALYSMSKFAVRGYTLSLAHELRGTGIAATVVCPDAVQTPMLDLQKNAPQAALVFSGGAPLAPEQVVHAILKALRTRPLEVILPRWRGWLAKLALVFPGLALWFAGPLLRRGLRRQAVARKGGR